MYGVTDANQVAPTRQVTHLHTKNSQFFALIPKKIIFLISCWQTIKEYSTNIPV